MNKPQAPSSDNNRLTRFDAHHPTKVVLLIAQQGPVVIAYIQSDRRNQSGTRPKFSST
jgi:hypothetical protein